MSNQPPLMHLALYKGPPDDLPHKLSHWAIRAWFLSRWSHSELMIDGIGYSASARDGGVRSKQIDFYSGRWDLLPIYGAESLKRWALAYHEETKGWRYDYLGVAAYPLPWLFKHDPGKEFCFEHTANQLGLADAHRMTPGQLYDFAVSTWPPSMSRGGHGS